MRIMVAGLLGGLVMFFWGALAHTVLGLGDIGMHYGSAGAQTMGGLNFDSKKDGKASGIYIFPSIPKELMSDEAAVKAFATQFGNKPYALVVYAPNGNPGMVEMGPVLGKQFATDLAAALLLAYILSGLQGFSRRALAASAAGLFAALAIQIPLSTWYLFPIDYSLGIALKQLLGWALAGALIAWWLGRAERAV
jgi:hypothetical protein